MNGEAQEDQILMARAAWLYHIGGLNQEAVANRLGTTRARVNKMLSEARETGLVSVSIAPGNIGLLEIENKIKARYGLDTCICTPALGWDRPVPGTEKLLSQFAFKAVGAAAASHLRTHLIENPAAVVGTGWGRTLEQLTLNFASFAAPQAKFISLMGSLNANSSYNPYEVVLSLARATGGEGYVMPVPFIADSVEDRQVLLSQRTVRRTLEIARSTTVGYISIGELKEKSLLRRQDMVTAQEVSELRSAGAVGDTNGIFFDAEGQAVKHTLNDRTIALGFDDLRKSNMIALVAGSSKLTAAKGFLKSGVAKGLIVDGDTALLLANV